MRTRRSNALERAAIVCQGREITAADLGPVGAKSAPSARPASAPQRLDDLERAAIEQALAAFEGNRRRAADRLGIGVRTLMKS